MNATGTCNANACVSVCDRSREKKKNKAKKKKNTLNKNAIERTTYCAWNIHSKDSILPLKSLIYNGKAFYLE